MEATYKIGWTGWQCVRIRSRAARVAVEFTGYFCQQGGCGCIFIPSCSMEWPILGFNSRRVLTKRTVRCRITELDAALGLSKFGQLVSTRSRESMNKKKKALLVYYTTYMGSLLWFRTINPALALFGCSDLLIWECYSVTYHFAIWRV